MDQLFCTVLYCIVLYCSVVKYTANRISKVVNPAFGQLKRQNEVRINFICTVLYCTVLNSTILYYTTLHYYTVL